MIVARLRHHLRRAAPLALLFLVGCQCLVPMPTSSSAQAVGELTFRIAPESDATFRALTPPQQRQALLAIWAAGAEHFREFLALPRYEATVREGSLPREFCPHAFAAARRAALGLGPPPDDPPGPPVCDLEHSNIGSIKCVDPIPGALIVRLDPEIHPDRPELRTLWAFETHTHFWLPQVNPVPPGSYRWEPR